jgi:serine/threonine-protein kinase
MGVVYLARQPALERTVVLKKMRRDLLADPSMVERFQREARAAAMIHHQNVVAVYDCFVARGDHYIAQEYVDGPDLREILSKIGKLEPRLAARIALEVARGLEEIHSQGIVHRDLKPSNIIIGRSGEAKIADFGIAIEGRGAGLTRPGTMLGSVPYMSPEQMLGERVDYRSDLFSFGILLYEMITGVPPFRESDDGATDTLVERMQSGRYVSPRKMASRVPWYLVWLIRRCLKGNPARRARGATQVRKHLERWLGNVSPADTRKRIVEPLAARDLLRVEKDETEPTVAASRTRGRLRRWRRLWPVPAGATALLAVALLWWSSTADRGPTVSEPAIPAETEVTRAGASIPRVSSEPGTADPKETAAGPPSKKPSETATPIVTEPSQVRFVAYPWAEIRIEGVEPILTPQAAPIELAAGAHTVRFTHPTYGSAEYKINLTPGEERVLTHVYREAPKR